MHQLPRNNTTGQRFVSLRMITAWFLLSCGGLTANQSWHLTRTGAPVAAVIVPASSTLSRDDNNTHLRAARLLIDHLLKMSGATLPLFQLDKCEKLKLRNGRLVGMPDIETFILLGESSLTEHLGITDNGLGPGGIRLKTSGNVVALVGKKSPIDPAAIIYATVALLEELGCRYLWPGELGHIVPPERSVKVGALDVAYTPPVAQRHIRWWLARRDISLLLSNGLDRLQIDDHAAWQRQAQQRLIAPHSAVSWTRWHGAGGHVGLSSGHNGAGMQYGATWRAALDSHPEWCAQQDDGTRSGHLPRYRLCKSNPELIEWVADNISSYVTRHPHRKAIGLSPNDGTYASFCMCDRCQQLDPPEAPKVRFPVYAVQGKSQRHYIEYPSLSDRMVWYYNQIAERVTRTHPNLLFVIDIYSLYKTAPVRERPHPNLVGRYVSNDQNEWLKWQASGLQGLYWRPNLFWPGAKTGRIHLVTEEIADFCRFAATHGMLATDIDSIVDHWALSGLNYYVAARMIWNPQRQRSEIIDDYCHSGFGAGGTAIAAYFRTAERLGDSSYLASDQELATLRSLLDRAAAVTSDAEQIQQRIAFLRIGFNFHHLHTLLGRMAAAAVSGESVDRDLAKRLLNLNYVMMRDIAMNHILPLSTPHFISRSGHLAHLKPIGGRGFTATPEVMEAARGRSMTGRERSFQELFQLYSMADMAAMEGKVTKVELELTTDEDGQAVEN